MGLAPADGPGAGPRADVAVAPAGLQESPGPSIISIGQMTFTSAIGAIFMFPLSAIIRLCVALRIHPNVLTFVDGVCINLAAAWGWGCGSFVLAWAMMVAAAADLFDFIDGAWS